MADLHDPRLQLASRLKQLAASGADTNAETILSLRSAAQPTQKLISEYSLMSKKLATLRQHQIIHPLPDSLFNHFGNTPVINMADGGHENNLHFLSLLDPRTIEKAAKKGVTDIILEGGDSNLTPLYNEYLTELERFRADPNHRATVLGVKNQDGTLTGLNETEYKANIYGALQIMFQLHQSPEEAGLYARSQMDALDQASKLGIRFHSTGTPLTHTYTAIAKELEKVPPEVDNPAGMFFNKIPAITPAEKIFEKKLDEAFDKDRLGESEVNRQTAAMIQDIYEQRKAEGKPPKIWHMHGMLHFTETNDIDNMLNEARIANKTIGLADSISQIRRAIKWKNESPKSEDFQAPTKWFSGKDGTEWDITEKAEEFILQGKKPEGEPSTLYSLPRHTKPPEPQAPPHVQPRDKDKDSPIQHI